MLNIFTTINSSKKNKKRKRNVSNCYFFQVEVTLILFFNVLRCFGFGRLLLSVTYPLATRASIDVKTVKQRIEQDDGRLGISFLRRGVEQRILTLSN